MSGPGFLRDSSTFGGDLNLVAQIVLVAGTPLVPSAWRFHSYARWMRTLLALWWLEIGLGVLTDWFATS